MLFVSFLVTLGVVIVVFTKRGLHLAQFVLDAKRSMDVKVGDTINIMWHGKIKQVVVIKVTKEGIEVR